MGIHNTVDIATVRWNDNDSAIKTQKWLERASCLRYRNIAIVPSHHCFVVPSQHHHRTIVNASSSSSMACKVNFMALSGFHTYILCMWRGFVNFLSIHLDILRKMYVLPVQAIFCDGKKTGSSYVTWEYIIILTIGQASAGWGCKWSIPQKFRV